MAGDEALVQKGLIALALLAVAAFLPRLVGRLRRRPMIEVAQLERWLDEPAGPLILDVRTEAEYRGEQGHIRESVNIPVDLLEARVGELGPDPERGIAIVCRTDRRSAKAAALLARRGFADVHVVRGGMTAWNAAGWEVER